MGFSEGSGVVGAVVGRGDGALEGSDVEGAEVVGKRLEGAGLGEFVVGRELGGAVVGSFEEGIGVGSRDGFGVGGVDGKLVGASVGGLDGALQQIWYSRVARTRKAAKSSPQSSTLSFARASKTIVVGKDVSFEKKDVKRSIFVKAGQVEKEASQICGCEFPRKSDPEQVARKDVVVTRSVMEVATLIWTFSLSSSMSPATSTDSRAESR